MSILIVIFGMFLEALQLIMAWWVYQDVATYTPLPHFALAQFIGIGILVNIFSVVFGRNYKYIHDCEQIPKAKKLTYSIAVFLTCMLLTTFYYFVKFFM